MPDEKQPVTVTAPPAAPLTEPAPSTTQPDSLEDLFHEAMQQPATTFPVPELTTVDERFVDTISTDAACKVCQQDTRRVCPTCHGPYCRLHASILDPAYCNMCLNEADANITQQPLIDSEGVTHAGRSMSVSGPAFDTTAKRICEMSRYQLEAYIDKYKDLIKQAERVLDFRRLQKGAAELELDQRKDTERRALRGIRLPGHPATASASPTRRRSDSKPISNANLLNMVQALKALQDLKKSKDNNKDGSK